MEMILENIESQKLRGGYYTPKIIATFISKWAISFGTNRVLEPSCGDGNFIEAAVLRFRDLGVFGHDLNERIKGIEFDDIESLKAKGRARDLGLNDSSIVNSDFFHFAQEHQDERYDVVLGNPPFIRYQNFPEKHRSIAIEMMQALNLNPNKLTNIWVPFLVISSSLLRENGKLGMVVPAELFQVKYAAQTRVFLSKFFERITIVTFKKLVFSDIQQEVVILLCEKNVAENHGIRVIECDGLDDLNNINFNLINASEVKSVDHSTEKWTKYFLEPFEIELLKRLKVDERIIRCGELMEVDVGIVTGNNEFFMMNEAAVKYWKLKSYVVPVTSKSNQLKGISFGNNDLKSNSDAGNDIYLFSPPNKEFEALPKSCQRYILHGEKNKFHTGYKCSIRKKWFVTPSVWIPDGFALRQVSDYPKIVLNKTNSSSTDTIHRIRITKGVNPRILPMLFLNSLSFAFSEITGRSYGGGVLTFEPTEIEDLRIPKLQLIDINFKEIDHLIRKREIEKVLDIVDNELLVRLNRFSQEEVSAMRQIWRKLSNRRLVRARSK